MIYTISVIIPNHNGSATLAKCLEAALASRYPKFEVVVVDDCSEDNSVAIINQFPCKLIRLDKPSGASKARNIGALNSHADILFFTDADCLLRKDTLSLVAGTFSEGAPDSIIGGTYTPVPYDRGFFSIFQSIFIHYSETKKPKAPDYIATHALAVDALVFKNMGGFSEDFLPILEDVELSHRLRKSGCRLVLNPDIMVQHIFNFTMVGSLRNAVKKSMYWTLYSVKNRDLFADSGTASFELKFNVVSHFINFILLLLWIPLSKFVLLYLALVISGCNILVNRKLLKTFFQIKGFKFAFFAWIYYALIYPLAVQIGAVAGMIKYLLNFL
jgi:glycosyltransferase involved in cell wall biosynthesis